MRKIEYHAKIKPAKDLIGRLARISVWLSFLFMVMAVIAKLDGSDPEGWFDWIFLLGMAIVLALLALAMRNTCSFAEVPIIGKDPDEEDPDGP